MKVLASSPSYARFLADFPEPWRYWDDKTTADLLRHAGFVDVKTSLDAAPTAIENREQYINFMKTIILRAHLERLPNQQLRELYVAHLADQAAEDHPPFRLDYWRLNLSARAG